MTEDKGLLLITVAATYKAFVKKFHGVTITYDLAKSLDGILHIRADDSFTDEMIEASKARFLKCVEDNAWEWLGPAPNTGNDLSRHVAECQRIVAEMRVVRA